MGYEIHIIRSDEWLDTTGREITESEWRQVVESDPEMRFVGGVEPLYPLAAEWPGHPQLASVLFDFRDGQVIVKSPDERIINKTIEVAKKLGARVQGDEGEFYDEPQEVPPSTGEKLKAWWMRFTKGS